MSASAISTHLADGILRIQIDRPEKRNALTAAMYADLAAAFERAADDPDTRVVLVHGHPQVFTAGNDLADFVDATPAGEDAPVLRFLRAISTAPKPIVAAVDGPAVGIGTTLLLHCDLVYAGASARFQLPFVTLGLVPEAGSTLLLPAVAGYRRAAELLLLGEPFSADEAQACGIVNAVVADGETLATATRAATRLAAKPPSAIRLTKQLLKQPSAAAVAEQIRLEAEQFQIQLRSPEAAEALQAFLNK